MHSCHWQRAEEPGLGHKILSVFEASAVFITLSYLNKLFYMAVSMYFRSPKKKKKKNDNDNLLNFILLGSKNVIPFRILATQ